MAANRGVIRDRKGRILAESVSSSVELTLKSKKNTKKSFKKTSGIKRVYPYGELLSSVLGYIGTDGNGLAGVEYSFDQYLRGENGWSIIQKDGLNRRYSRIGMPKKIPQNGCDIYLTIDVQVQKIVEKVLIQSVKKYNAKAGMAIVMDPVTGNVLAMASVPTFNPNFWKQYSANQRINRCISHNYEPGSTFKVITAASALQENIMSEYDSIDANQGKYKIYDQVIRDHKAYGKLSFAQALSYSSNVCFAKIADELGNKRLYAYTRDFGFGAGSGINLAGEENGILHPVSNWSGRTRVTMAMGQEITSTLLQMVVAFSVVANGGVLIEPHIYDKIVGLRNNQIKENKVKARRRVISEDVALRLRRMMKGVVDNGTGKRCRLPGLAIGGKTGTSQKIDKETSAYSQEAVWASFIGFAPVDCPELVCGVMLDEPANGESGGASAGPAFKQILQQLISHPDLGFAEKLIGSEISDTVHNMKNKLKKLQTQLPDMCGMDRIKASALLVAEGICFEILGTESVVAYQSPPAGRILSDNSVFLLYTGKSGNGNVESYDHEKKIRVPNCIGKDLRDAVNAINLKGLVPYIEGSGIVQKQEPGIGAMVKSMEICTLVCSFEG